ncbi:HDOD domain-containing protein [Vibrio sp. JPW-9-11-11]|uniref:HDOD domain-containing protein n=1 Tax=Vibrio sp. JPW-9-11-11 TaxID=1416532 RepID=UPI0015938A45|nr:HDOD domain-containing protein [Vibrio sp. JPW-9-11-11]NVD08660.1 HDOD domain-containing protein [Vibrio sp. JPW-9-11-11]
MSQEALLSRIDELPRIEKVLQELLDMVNQPEVNFTQLAQKISTDQVLSARLLRLANAAYFGAQKTIGSVNEAVVRVGTAPVRTLVVVSALSSVFPRIRTLDMDQYWGETFEVAVLASKIAQQTDIDGDDMFTTGILHNIGELMIHTLVPEQAIQIQQRAQAGENALDVQEELLDITAPTLGAKLAKTWQFPEEMVDAIANFDDPRDAEVSPKLATTLHLARAIHRDWDLLESEEGKSRYLAEHPDSRLLDLPSQFVETIDHFRGSGRDLAVQLNAS